MGKKLTAAQARVAIKNREATLQRIYKRECEESLFHFMYHAWHVLVPNGLKTGNALRAICDHFQALSSGDIQFLLVNVPPGFSKSLVANVFLPAWEWGPRNMPYQQYLNLSYAQGLSVRDSRKLLDLIQSDWYQQKWGDRFQLREDHKGVMEFSNTHKGTRSSMSIAGKLTGFRGTRIVVDDPHNVKDGESDAVREKTVETFASALQSRTNSEDTAFAVIMQRVHSHDVSGHILENNPEYTHLCLPMHKDPDYTCWTKVKPSWHDGPPEKRVKIKLEDEVWPRYVPREEAVKLQDLGEIDSEDPLQEDVVWRQDLRDEPDELLMPSLFSKERTDRLVRAMQSVGGEYHTAGQLEQRPAPREGGMFKRDDFRVMTSREIREEFSIANTVRGWDLAGTETDKADWTVGVRMSRAKSGEFIVHNVVRNQYSPGKVEELLKTIAKADGIAVRQSIPQDPGQAGKAQKRALGKLLAGYDVRFSLESGDKATRARPMAAQTELGNVIVQKGPWNRVFFHEVCGFPNGKWDDIVDAMARAFNELLKIRSKVRLAAPRVVKLVEYPQ